MANARAVVAASVVVAVALLLSAVFALKPSAGTDALVPRASSANQATDMVRARFGGDPIVVMVEENLRHLLLTTDIGRVLELEGCLGGKVPKGVTPYGGASGPCAAIAKSGSVQVVYGPATFLNEAASQISGAVGGELAKIQAGIKAASSAARAQALAAGYGAVAADKAAAAASANAQRNALETLGRLQAQTGLSSLPSLANGDFVSQVVFDASRGVGIPKARFSYLFPSPNAALIQVRPRPGLTTAQTRELINNVNRVTGLPGLKPKYGGSYFVTGAPVLAESLANDVAAGAVPLLIAALIVMALVLLLFFRTRLRLLPLGLAMASGAIVFGAMAVFGLPLTVAAVGGIPVLIGLAVDYAVQLQARTAEAMSDGERRDLEDVDPEDIDSRDDLSINEDHVRAREKAVIGAARVGGPPIAAAALATAGGFLALMLSPVPMVRGFGLVLVAGVFVALLVAFTTGSASLALLQSPGFAQRLSSRVDASVRGAVEIVSGFGAVKALARRQSRAAALLARKPVAVLVVSLLIAACGWALEGQLSVESDIARLVPSNTPALKALNALQEQTGVAGEVDVLLTGERVTDPVTLKWLADVQTGALKRWGYDEAKGCRGAALCPGVSISDLPTGGAKTQQQVIDALNAIPVYFRQAVIADRGRAGLAAFGVRLLPLTKQQEVFDDLRKRVSNPPNGVSATVAGLPVIAAQANTKLADESNRRLIAITALAAVALVLILVLRSFVRVAVPLLATALATGWASLGLWILGVELNPMSAALGALVIAIATEFAVLLSERHRLERSRGLDGDGALAVALSTTGRAIAISGMTVVAGFAVLGLSDIQVLREFGFATVVDLALAFAAVRLIVPAGLRVAFARENPTS